MVPKPPDLLHQRSNSHDGIMEPGAVDSPSSPSALRREVSQVRDIPAPPPLLPQRSNSLGDMPSFPSYNDSSPSQSIPPRVQTASCVGGSTPRAARFEQLEWEESGARPDRQQECIRVAARFRPLDVSEMELGADNLCVKFGSDGKSCTIMSDRTFGSKETDFFYDHVFQPPATQSDVYYAVAQPIVEGIINGVNGAIIAYGQTGSGKTHTMLGPDGAKAFLGDGDVNMEEMGVIPRALQELLDYARPTEGQVQLRASYVEIYQEHIIDLLAPTSDFAVVRDQKQALHLPEVTETPIGSIRDALAAMRTGNKNRHMAETRMNRHSSRSHAVFVVTVTNTIDRSRQKYAQLYLVDLAGSERVGKTGVSGQTLEEAKQINKSLLALGQVIWSLAHKQKHIPYRDSKLTRLLQNCLGGNARTAILISASPHMRNANESLSALRFGARASLVQNSARVNVAEDPKELKRLLEQAKEDLNQLRGHCQRLQAELSAFQAAEFLPAPVQARRTSSRMQPAAEGGPLPMLTAKRLLIWGLLPSLVCPLTRAIMREPVCAADGWSYERVAIERHFARSGRKMPQSPVTGQRMTTRQLVPNHVIKQLVKQHLPDLAPIGLELPMMQLLHIWHVQEILSFLDGKSLGCCEAAWTSFLAAAASSSAWARLLARDFPSAAASAESGTAAGDAAEGSAPVSAKARYAEKAMELARAGAGSRARVAPPSRGLFLRAT